MHALRHREFHSVEEDSVSTKRTLVRNTAANIVAQLAQMLSAFVFMPLLITRFGTVDYGVYLLVSSVSGYFGLLDLGVGASLVKYVAEHRARGERHDLSETVSTALVFYGVIGVVASVSLAAIALFGLPLLSLPESSASLARNLLLVGAGASLFAWPLGMFNSVLAGHQRYDLTARLGIAATIVNIAVTALVITTGQSPLTLLAGTSAVGLTVAALSARLATRELGDTMISLRRATWPRLKRIFRFSSAVFVMQLCGVLVYQQTDRLVLGIFASAASITLYEAASKLHSLIRTLAGLSASAAMPTVSALDATGHHSAILELFMRGTKYTVLLVAPAVVIVMVLAGPFLRVWLGSTTLSDADFSTMTIGTQIYVSYWLLNVNTTIPGTIINGIGKLRFALWYTIVGSALNVLLSVILVQRLGVLGVIVGTVIPYYLGFPVYMRVVSRLIGFRIQDWLRQVIVPSYPLLLIPLGITLVGKSLNLCTSLAGTAAVGVVAIAGYWGAAYGIALNGGERAEVRSAIHGVRSAVLLSRTEL